MEFDTMLAATAASAWYKNNCSYSVYKYVRAQDAPCFHIPATPGIIYECCDSTSVKITKNANVLRDAAYKRRQDTTALGFLLKSEGISNGITKQILELIFFFIYYHLISTQ